MHTRFYVEVTGISASLVAFWAGLSKLPPTGWLINVFPGERAWSLGALALVVGAVLAALLLGGRAMRRALPLPTVPGLRVRTSGYLAAALGVFASLILYWWVAAGEGRLPVGMLGWLIGIVALGSLTWVGVAAGTLWLGNGIAKERELEEVAPGQPIGLA